ncbi:hypothetical protein E4T39_00962 [Aureobasidium subglaciale]|nr:hypothetical protein E4T39_00962 [Aureobasidium subglaciale]
MHFLALAPATFLALASPALATFATVQNNCAEPVWITITNTTFQTVQYQIATNGTYTQWRVGTGNAYGLSKTSAYFSTSTPKFTLGFSDSPQRPLLYWSVINVDGDPFAGEAWRISLSDPACTPNLLAGYDGGKVHACEAVTNLTVPEVLPVLGDWRWYHVPTGLLKVFYPALGWLGYLFV